MGMCSYTWKELDEEKGEFTRKRCPEERWEGSDKFCVFHDSSTDKDIEFFKQKMEGKTDCNFRGYFFPGRWSFRNKKFRENSNFRGATFKGTSDFSGATFKNVDFRGATFKDVDFRKTSFQGNADFRGATFKDAYFSGVTFKGNVIFRGATFKDADFSGVTFQNADFSGVTFKGTADFRGVTFKGTADFRGVTFKGTADFRGVTFKGTAYFRDVTFQNADFRGVTFQDADFRGATFHRKLELFLENVKRIDLRYTEFLFRSFITADLTNALFHRAFLENVAFIDCTWPRNYIIYEEGHMKDKMIYLSFNKLEAIYRDLKQNMQRHGDYTTAGELFYREMEMKRKGTSKMRERGGLTLYKLLAGYGERYWNIATVSVSIILMFALLYGTTDCLQYSIENPRLHKEIIDVVYFSFVTFTTLGLGDITPLTSLGKILICCEAIVGAFMIAVFVVVFVRKMAR